MKKDPFEQYNTKQTYLLDNESEEDSLDRVDARIRKISKGNPRLPLLRWMPISAAAIFLLLIGITFFFDQNASVDSVFEPYPNYRTTTERGDNQADDVYKLYKEGLFSEFIIAFDDLPSKTAADTLYAAIAHGATDDWTKSLELLKSTSSTIPQEFRQAHDWYLSLAYLKNDDTAEAQILLENIRASDSEFADEAAQLLEDHDQLRK